MPRNPDFRGRQIGEPFASYQGRVGRLYRGAVAVGLLLVTVDQKSIQVSGHLWWTRWGPSEDFFWLFTIVDGKHDDMLTEATEDELHDWEQSRYEYYGEVLRLAWVPQPEAGRLASSEFGYDGPHA